MNINEFEKEFSFLSFPTEGGETEKPAQTNKIEDHYDSEDNKETEEESDEFAESSTGVAIGKLGQATGESLRREILKRRAAKDKAVNSKEDAFNDESEEVDDQYNCGAGSPGGGAIGSMGGNTNRGLGPVDPNDPTINKDKAKAYLHKRLDFDKVFSDEGKLLIKGATKGALIGGLAMGGAGLVSKALAKKGIKRSVDKYKIAGTKFQESLSPYQLDAYRKTGELVGLNYKQVRLLEKLKERRQNLTNWTNVDKSSYLKQGLKSAAFGGVAGAAIGTFGTAVKHNPKNTNNSEEDYYGDDGRVHDASIDDSHVLNKRSRLDEIKRRARLKELVGNKRQYEREKNDFYKTREQKEKDRSTRKSTVDKYEGVGYFGGAVGGAAAGYGIANLSTKQLRNKVKYLRSKKGKTTEERLKLTDMELKLDRIRGLSAVGGLLVGGVAGNKLGNYLGNRAADKATNYSEDDNYSVHPAAAGAGGALVGGALGYGLGSYTGYKTIKNYKKLIPRFEFKIEKQERQLKEARTKGESTKILEFRLNNNKQVLANMKKDVANPKFVRKLHRGIHTGTGALLGAGNGMALAAMSQYSEEDKTQK